MMARRRGGDAGLRGEDARRELTAVAECEQDLGARRLGEQRPDAGQIRVADHPSMLVAEPFDAGRSVGMQRFGLMITCCIQYTLDPRKMVAFEDYATRWPPIIARCGGGLVGYYLPKEGANNFALALIDFSSLAAYETYRERLRADADAQRNVAEMLASGCVLVESRTFLRRSD